MIYRALLVWLLTEFGIRCQTKPFGASFFSPFPSREQARDSQSNLSKARSTQLVARERKSLVRGYHGIRPQIRLRKGLTYNNRPYRGSFLLLSSQPPFLFFTPRSKGEVCIRIRGSVRIPLRRPQPMTECEIEMTV